MRAIDGETLYERACDLEAQALAYVGKIVNDESKIEEWKIWSAILAERTAFKHDVFDAPTIEPQRKKGKWIRITQGAIPEIYICPFCNRTLKDTGIDSLVHIRYPFCHCGADMREEN